MVEVKTLVSGAIIALIVTAFIGALAVESQRVTTLTTQTETVNIAPARLAAGAINETYTFTLNTGVANWRNEYSECIPTTITYTNQTSGTLTDPTHYVYTYNAGTLTLKNVLSLNTSSLNTTSATYNYCPNNYLASSWGRTLLNTTPGLIAIGLLVAMVAIAYVLLKKEGIGV